VTITCDSCQGDYRALRTNARAYVYIKDRRTNHVGARCSHCGTLEVIFLGPSRLAEMIRFGELPVDVHAEAGSDLRVRAERAWAAADATPLSSTEVDPSCAETPGPQVAQYELTPRHEQLLAGFATTLTSIPDDLLWDGLSSDHHSDQHRDHPERWVD
jgi:hypothetical protein